MKCCPTELCLELCLVCATRLISACKCKGCDNKIHWLANSVGIITNTSDLTDFSNSNHFAYPINEIFHDHFFFFQSPLYSLRAFLEGFLDLQDNQW